MTPDQERKLDKIGEQVARLGVVAAKQQVILDEHIRRTGLAEVGISKLGAALVKLGEDFAALVKPLQKHVDRVQFVFVALGVLCTAAGGVAAIIESIQYITHR